MDDQRPARASGIIVIVATMVIIFVLSYVGAYRLLAERRLENETVSMPGTADRHFTIMTYRHRWEAILFNPAGKIETMLTGTPVLIHAPQK